MSSAAAMFALAAVSILLAGLLVAAETAVTRVSRVTIEQLKRDGDKRAHKLLTMLDDRARYVNALLFAHLTLSTLAAIFVTVGFLKLVPDSTYGVIYAAVVMVVVGYILLGVAPQTLGRQHAERYAVSLGSLIRFTALILGPFSRLFILIGNAITPGKGYREGPFSTQAELRELVDMAGADSVIEDDERQMIHSVFELGDTVAREVMVPRTEMVWVEGTKTLRQAMSLCLRSGYSRIPVIGENIDDIVGVIYLKDIAQRTFEHHDAETTERVIDLMRPAFMVPDSRSVDELLHDMQSARTHLAVLVDEYGGTAGIVTIEDVIEEIVGEISDEYDVVSQEIEELADGRYRISSRLSIYDLAQLIKVEIEDDDVDTVAGLMAKRLGIVPISGANVKVEGWSLTAESAAGRRNRIGTVLIEPDVFATAEDENE
jgi:CBS domain containing-hemolysin-like protein